MISDYLSNDKGVEFLDEVRIKTVLCGKTSQSDQLGGFTFGIPRCQTTQGLELSYRMRTAKALC